MWSAGCPGSLPRSAPRSTRPAESAPRWRNVGAYFQKINCFCFTEQRLKPGETRDMPVVFYVDPALARDADQETLDTITLSYSFYPLREQPKPVADSAGATGRI